MTQRLKENEELAHVWWICGQVWAATRTMRKYRQVQPTVFAIVEGIFCLIDL